MPLLLFADAPAQSSLRTLQSHDRDEHFRWVSCLASAHPGCDWQGFLKSGVDVLSCGSSESSRCIEALAPVFDDAILQLHSGVPLGAVVSSFCAHNFLYWAIDNGHEPPQIYFKASTAVGQSMDIQAKFVTVSPIKVKIIAQAPSSRYKCLICRPYEVGLTARHEQNPSRESFSLSASSPALCSAVTLLSDLRRHSNMLLISFSPNAGSCGCCGGGGGGWGIAPQHAARRWRLLS